MFFDKVKWIVLTQHGGFTRMPSSCGKKSHRNPALRTEVPRSMLWWRRWNQPFPRSTPWAEKTLEGTVNLFLSSRWSCLQRLLQVNERFSGTLDENQGSTCCFSTPKFPTRWFAIPDLNWSDSDLWGKSFHITIKHVRLKKSLYRWFMTKISHESTMQDLEVRDGQELLWTSRLGSFNSLLVFSCKHFSSSASANVFVLQNNVILPQPFFFFNTCQNIKKTLSGQMDSSRRKRLGHWIREQHENLLKRWGLIKKSSASELRFLRVRQWKYQWWISNFAAVKLEVWTCFDANPAGIL